MAAAYRNKLISEENTHTANTFRASGFRLWTVPCSHEELSGAAYQRFHHFRGKGNHINTLMGGSFRFVGRNHSLPAERLSFPVSLAQCLLSTVHAQIHHPEIDTETHYDDGKMGIIC